MRIPCLVWGSPHLSTPRISEGLQYLRPSYAMMALTFAGFPSEFISLLFQFLWYLALQTRNARECMLNDKKKMHSLANAFRMGGKLEGFLAMAFPRER